MYSTVAPPEWDETSGGYVDPKSRKQLQTWAEALDVLDADPAAEPAHVVRMGRIDPRDIKGVDQGTKDAERSVRYVTKYITKDLTDTVEAAADPQRAHLERLHAELAVLPCAATCANWLLYGISPTGPRPG